MRATLAVLALSIGLAGCQSDAGMFEPEEVTPEYATTGTWPTGTIHKYYTVGGKTFGIHILPTPTGSQPMQCAPDPGGQLIDVHFGACGGSGGGGGSAPATYGVAATCSSPSASVECALKALNLTITGGIMAGTCMASWTGAAAAACYGMVYGWGTAATNYMQTPDCRSCPPPLAYPTLRPAPGYTGWEEQ